MLQFMRPRARDKKLQEEWAVPLNGIEDICEVCFRLESVLTGCFRLVSTSCLYTVLMKLILIRYFPSSVLENSEVTLGLN